MNSSSMIGKFDKYPARTSTWKRNNMDDEQRMANTMQLHRRRFEYLDTHVKGL